MDGGLTEPSESSSPRPLLATQDALPCSHELPEDERTPVPGCDLWGWCGQIRIRAVIFLSRGDFPGVESEMWWLSSSSSGAISRKMSKLVPGSPSAYVQWGKQREHPAPENYLVKSCRAGEAQHAACCALPNCAGHVPSSDVYGGFFPRAESLHLCFQFKFSHKSEQKACKVQHLPNCPI